MSDSRMPGSLTDDELATWASVATLLEWLPRALDAQLQSDAGVTHFEYGVMYALVNAPERTLRMSDLAGYSNSSLTRLSRAVARLEARGWASRTTDPTDGRYTLATLTDAGRELVERASPGHVELVSRLVFRPLTKTQARQLGAISQRILSALDAESRWRPQPRA